MAPRPQAARPATVMPAEPTQARRFGKTRTALSTALLEDYAELIADLLASEGEARPTDIARRLGVSHATAIKTIARLKREGLATARPYRGVFLTEAGDALAARVRARHRLVVDLLTAVGVPQEAAEQDAEGIEHHVSDATLSAFARFLADGRLPAGRLPAGRLPSERLPSERLPAERPFATPARSVGTDALARVTTRKKNQ